jgi:aryl-alcohol dehydrogenase-like predicted oxidoreductase
MKKNIFKEWKSYRLGLGTYQLSPDKRVRPDDAKQILKKASELGINLIDTAPLYGGGYVELLIGETSFSNDVKIINKLGRYESLASYRKIANEAYNDEFMIFSQFEFSLKLLNRQFIDLLLIHEADWDIWWQRGLGKGAIINVLTELKKRGLVKKIGISLRNPFIARELCNTGIFDAVLFVHYYNILWQDSREIFFNEAKKNNMGIAIGTPYKQGLLISNKDSHLENILKNRPKDLSDSLLKRLIELIKISKSFDMSLPEMSLRFLLSDKDVDVVFAGPRSIDELELNVQWTEKGSLPEELLNKILELRDIKLEEGYRYEKV